MGGAAAALAGRGRRRPARTRASARPRGWGASLTPWSPARAPGSPSRSSATAPPGTRAARSPPAGPGVTAPRHGRARRTGRCRSTCSRPSPAPARSSCSPRCSRAAIPTGRSTRAVVLGRGLLAPLLAAYDATPHAPSSPRRGRRRRCPPASPSTACAGNAARRRRRRGHRARRAACRRPTRPDAEPLVRGSAPAWATALALRLAPPAAGAVRVRAELPLLGARPRRAGRAAGLRGMRARVEIDRDRRLARRRARPGAAGRRAARPVAAPGDDRARAAARCPATGRARGSSCTRRGAWRPSRALGARRATATRCCPRRACSSAASPRRSGRCPRPGRCAARRRARRPRAHRARARRRHGRSGGAVGRRGAAPADRSAAACSRDALRRAARGGARRAGRRAPRPPLRAGGSRRGRRRAGDGRPRGAALGWRPLGEGSRSPRAARRRGRHAGRATACSTRRQLALALGGAAVLERGSPGRLALRLRGAGAGAARRGRARTRGRPRRPAPGSWPRWRPRRRCGPGSRSCAASSPASSRWSIRCWRARLARGADAGSSSRSACSPTRRDCAQPAAPRRGSPLLDAGAGVLGVGGAGPGTWELPYASSRPSRLGRARA